MFLEKVKLRLESLGYEVTEDDEVALEFAAEKVYQYIKHFCNIEEVPDCLEWVGIEMCAGEFLQAKKSLGKLTTMQVQQIVKSIEDGDTTVSFQSGVNPETTFNEYLDKMIHGYTDSLIAHRCLKW